MDEQLRYQRNTKVILGVVATLMGLLYYVMAWKLRTALESVESMRLILVGRGVVAPYALFIIVSLAFGWFTVWLAETRGLVTWVPLAVTVVIAIGLGLGISALSIRPWPKTMVLAFGLAAAAFMAAGALRQKLEY